LSCVRPAARSSCIASLLSETKKQISFRCTVRHYVQH
jgi:hypothetical protein